MLDNNTYNLMAQIVEESQSLWRIRNTYMADSTACMGCQDYSLKLAQDIELHMKDLENLIVEHTQLFAGARS